MTISYYTDKNLLQTLHDTSFNGLENFASSISPSQLTECAMLLGTEPIPEAPAKLIRLFELANEPAHLECLGRGLSAPQFLSLLTEVTKTPPLQKKLSPILVGLPSIAFIDSLHHMNSAHLTAIKQESIGEPLHHQFIFFVHNCEYFLDEINLNLLQQLKDIQELDIYQLSFMELDRIENQINDLGRLVFHRLEAINQVLVILWNANLIDLIDKFSRLKENFNHFVYEQIGRPAISKQPSTGIYRVLDERLAQVFIPYDPSLKKNVSLGDDDPALEGLARFSIWYLKDYWDLGLLPSIQKAEDLELNSPLSNEEEQIAYRQTLFNQVQRKLNELGIGTIKDLKNARIFSKPMLISYITKHSEKNSK
ncbi:MAG: hypothetical protein H0V82_00740 [Candidatus Protochlamydia sp.]|nr:hypothetical protein [Candidatus Protochlamydia sp.]